MSPKRKPAGGRVTIALCDRRPGRRPHLFTSYETSTRTGGRRRAHCSWCGKPQGR